MDNKVISIHALAYYIERIRLFHESSKKNIRFPSISSQLENVLVRIVTENTDFLNEAQYDEKVKMEGANLTAVMNSCSSFKLVHEFVEKDGQKVLTYRKEFPDTTAPPKPLRMPREAQASSSNVASSCVSGVFKTRCLNDTTKFVKDDSSLVMTYPEMTDDEVEFVMGMLMQGKEGDTNQIDVGYGYRSMYAPLWESMRLFSSKYRYNIKQESSNSSTGKRIVFEKVPKYKPPEKNDVSATDDASSSDASTSQSSPAHALKEAIKLPKKVQKLNTLISSLRSYINQHLLTKEFIQTTLRKIQKCMTKEEEASIIFNNVNNEQYYFLLNVERICKNDGTYMLFTSECQQYLTSIKFCFSKNVKFTIKTTKWPGVSFEKQVVFTKQAVFLDDGEGKCETAPKKVTNEIEVANINRSAININLDKKIGTNQKQIENLSGSTSVTGHSSSAIASSPLEEPIRSKNKKKKVNNLIQTLGTYMKEGLITNKFIEQTVERVNNFVLNNGEKSLVFEYITRPQFYFLENLQRVCIHDPTHSLFTSESLRYIISIKRCLHNNVKYTINTCRYSNERLEKQVRFKKQSLLIENKEIKPQPAVTTVKQENVKDSTTSFTALINSKLRFDLQSLQNVKEKITQNEGGEQFILSALRDISYFLSKTNQESSLFYDNASPEEFFFLKNILVLSASDETYRMFTRECQQLLRTIKSRANNFDLDFIGHNVPSADESTDNLSNIFVTISKTDAHNGKEQIERQRARSLSTRHGRPITKTSKVVALSSARARSTQRQQALPLAKVKLVEGLAQPVQSEKATKMMQIMGWTGGALGVRGDGITEPIVPEIERIQRLGFGAPIPEPKQSKKKVNKPSISVPSHSFIGNLVQSTAAQVYSAQNFSGRDMTDLLPYGVLPCSMIPTNLLPPHIHPAGIDPIKLKTVLLDIDYRLSALKAILEIITTPLEAIKMVAYVHKVRKERVINFVKSAVTSYNRRSGLRLEKVDYKSYETAVLAVFKKNPKLKLHVVEVMEHEAVVIRVAGFRAFKKRIGTAQGSRSSLRTQEQDYNSNVNESVSREWYEEVRLETQITIDLPNDQESAEVLQKNEGISMTNEVKSAENCNAQGEASKLKTIEDTIKILKDVKIDYESENAPTAVVALPEEQETIKDKQQQQDDVTACAYNPQVESKLSENTVEKISTDTEQEVQHAQSLSSLNTNIENVIEKEAHEIQYTTKETNKIQDKPTDSQNLQDKIIESQNLQENATDTQKVQETEEAYKLNEITKVTQNSQEKTKDPQLLQEKTKDVQNLSENPNATHKQVNINDNSSFSKNYKYFTLIHLLDFCRSENTSKTIHLKEDMPPKMMAYIYVIISVINSKSEFTGPSMENNMIDRIQSVMSNYHLSANIDMPKTIILVKVPCESINNNSTSKNMNIPSAVQTANMANTIATAQPANKNNIHIDLNGNDMHVSNNEDETNAVIIPNLNRDDLTSEPKENTDNIAKLENNPNIIVLKSNDITSILDLSRNNQDNNNNIEMVKNVKNVIETFKNVHLTETLNVESCNHNSDNVNNNQNSPSGTEVAICTKQDHDVFVKTESANTSSNTIKKNKYSIQTNDNDKPNANISKTPKINNGIDEYGDDCQILIDYSEIPVDIDNQEENLLLLSDDKTEFGCISNASIGEAKSIDKHFIFEELNNEIQSIQNKVTDDATSEVKVKLEKDNTTLKSQHILRKRHSTKSIVDDDQTMKKCKLLIDYKKLIILHHDYPQTKINSEKARELQMSILSATDLTNENLPMLTCHGIQNGGLIYNCHNENSLTFMEDWIKTVPDYRMVHKLDAEENVMHKMAFRINSYIDEKVCRILNRLEIYNSGLNATKWTFVKKEQYSDFIVIYVELDDISYRYVREANFVLPAGNDCARFTLLWD